MGRIAAILYTAFALTGAAAPPAEPHPNLSGTWKMDPSRSESAHQAVPIGAVFLLIRQTPTTLTIETRRTEAGTGKIQTETLPYLLSGGESTTSAGEGQVAVKTRARWDGHRLITETERVVNGASVTTKYIHSLGAGGRELKLDKTLTVQHGYQFEGAKNYGTGVDVFVKSAP